MEIRERLESTTWEVQHWYRAHGPARDKAAITNVAASSSNIDLELDVIGGDLAEGDCQLVAEEYVSAGD